MYTAYPHWNIPHRYCNTLYDGIRQSPSNTSGNNSGTPRQDGYICYLCNHSAFYQGNGAYKYKVTYFLLTCMFKVATLQVTTNINKSVTCT